VPTRVLGLNTVFTAAGSDYYITITKEYKAFCDTVTLLPLVILHLEPHHMTPESTERSALNQHFLVRICHQYDISITTHIDLYDER
jgi:hypothetical protein